MANKRYTVNAPLSNKATGITPIQSVISAAKNGIKTQLIEGQIIVNSTLDAVIIKYKIQKLDSQGNPIEGFIPLDAEQIIKDIPARGTVEFDENDNPLWDTFIEETPEKLSLTDWNTKLSHIIIPPAIAHIEAAENIV